MIMNSIFKPTACALTIGCLFVAVAHAQNTTNYPRIGNVDRFDPALDGLISKDAKVESPVWRI